jgi:hypothetical protein
LEDLLECLGTSSGIASGTSELRTSKTELWSSGSGANQGKGNNEEFHFVLFLKKTLFKLTLRNFE